MGHGYDDKGTKHCHQPAAILLFFERPSDNRHSFFIFSKKRKAKVI
jgi:hypothetical protein